MIFSKKRIIGVILALAILAASLVTITFATAEMQTIDLNDIPSVQTYGTEYTLPKVKLNIDGQDVLAKTLLYKPDGTALSGKSANLDQAGEYTLKFVATSNGKLKTEQKTFKVISPIVTFSSKGNAFQYYSDNAENGLKISASSGAVATFSKVIDVKNLTKDQTFIRFKATPKYDGVSEIEKIEIKLTDIYDESNYLTFRIKAMSESGDKQVYMDAAASNQIFSARNRVNNKTTLYKNSQFGYTCFSNFYGKENLLGFGGKNAFSTPYFELRYDNEELAVYTHSPNGGLAKVDTERKYENIITFSSLDDFDNKWSGFTDGKVRVSLKATGTAANYLITDLYGIELTELTVEDIAPPILTVDLPKEVPTAVVGKEYTIFNASAYDIFSGERQVNAEVWFNLNGNAPVSVNVDGGKFKTDKVGTYSIVYTAKDSYGNKAKQIVEVNCKKDANQIIVQKTEDYSTAKQGDIITFKPVEFFGGSGNLNLKVSVIGGKYQEIENGFIPIETGEYKVVYTVTDYVGESGSLEVPVIVESQPIPVFTSILEMNEYLVDGNKYILPNIQAIDYADGAKPLTATVTVTDKNDTRVLDGLEYVPSVRNNGDSIKIVYTVVGKYGSNSIEKTITVAKTLDNDNNLILENYFIKPESVSVQFEPNGLKFNFNSDGEMKFINPVIADGFFTIFQISNNLSLEYVLNDKYDAAQKLTLKFYNDGTNVIIDVNGEITYTSTFNVEYMNDLAVKIDVKNKTLSFGGKTVRVESMPEFSSEYAYVSWKINSTDGESASFLLNEINGFRFRQITSDGSGPQILLYKSAVSVDIHQEVSTARAIFADVLSTYSKCKISVLSPNGNYIRANNGVLLDGNADASIIYNFTVDEFGIYTITYIAEDGSGATSRQQYMIRVWDDESPTITVNEIAKTQKVNSTVTLPDAIVKDNVTTNCTTFISIKTPNSKIENVTNGKYTFKSVGEYEIVYCAIDKNGNPVFYSYTVKVI